MNEIILIDKEINWTSNDVVRFLKKKFNPIIFDKEGKKIKKVLKQDEKKFRIGHAGTLDPFASGLLLIMLGDATKKFDDLQKLKKEYIAEIQFGKKTDTQDVTGQITFENKNFSLNSEFVEKVEKVLKENFLGKVNQIPPKYSAIKINGKRMYELMYKGKNISEEDLTKKKRQIEIYEYEILKDQINLKENLITVRFLVSSGTYIRTIANDLGDILQTGAYLKDLRRTKIGGYNVMNAKTINELGSEPCGDSNNTYKSRVYDKRKREIDST